MSHEYLATLPIPANFWDRAKQIFTHIEFSYYVRFITALCATAGFIPFDYQIIKSMIGCSRATSAECLLDKMSMYGEFELIDISQVPEDFVSLLGVDAQYSGKILRHKQISAFALHLQDKRRKLAIAADCRHKKLCEEKEKKRSKRKEKELLNTKPLQKSLQGAIQEPLREECSCQSSVLSRQPKALNEKAGQPVSQSASPPEKCFSFRDFRDLWNKWAEHFKVPQFQKLNTPLKAKFETRQKSFKAQGAETQMFWINLLSAIAETSGGFYLGKNDGYRHCGTPWIITAKWLLENDEHIERFLNAVA